MALYSTERALIIINDMKDISEHLGDTLTWNDVYGSFLEVFPSAFIEQRFDEIVEYLTEHEGINLDRM